MPSLSLRYMVDSFVLARAGLHRRSMIARFAVDVRRLLRCSLPGMPRCGAAGLDATATALGLRRQRPRLQWPSRTPRCQPCLRRRTRHPGRPCHPHHRRFHLCGSCQISLATCFRRSAQFPPHHPRPQGLRRRRQHPPLRRSSTNLATYTQVRMSTEHGSL